MTDINGSTSDGFHTFDELYHHRTILAALLLNQLPGLDPWKARLHNDGTMYDGFFIVGADTMGGQATYHTAATATGTCSMSRNATGLPPSTDTPRTTRWRGWSWTSWAASWT